MSGFARKRYKLRETLQQCLEQTYEKSYAVVQQYWEEALIDKRFDQTKYEEKMD